MSQDTLIDQGTTGSAVRPIGAPGAVKNHYFVFRHGFSRANHAKLIVSDPKNGLLPKFRLTPFGEGQVAESATHLARAIQDPAMGLKGCPIVVIASPFSRTVQTAQIVIATLNKLLATPEEKGRCKLLVNYPNPETIIDLRERFYGEYELKSDDFYHEVWKEDVAGIKGATPTLTLPVGQGNTKGVEPCASAWLRIVSLINRLESRYLPGGVKIAGKPSDKPVIFIMVSHGDVCQISQTAAAGFNAGHHRIAVPHISQANWRQLSGPPPGCKPCADVFKSKL